MFLIFLLRGSEEDFADQLATFVVADGDDDDELVAFDGAAAFLLMAKDTDARQTEFWSEHSLGAERFTNIMCWLYADGPNKYPERNFSNAPNPGRSVHGDVEKNGAGAYNEKSREWLRNWHF